MSSRYLWRRLGQAVTTILMIVLVNFLLFRAMPGSPDRILARNPNVSPAAIEQTRARWGIDKPLVPGSAGGLPRGDRPGRPRPLVRVPWRARHRGHRRPTGPDAPAVRARRGHRDLRRPRSRRLRGLATRRSGRPGREWRVAGALLHAVLPARHDPVADLRLDAPLVPVIRHDDTGEDLRLGRSSTSPTSARTSCYRSRPSPSA